MAAGDNEYGQEAVQGPTVGVTEQGGVDGWARAYWNILSNDWAISIYEGLSIYGCRRLCARRVIDAGELYKSRPGPPSALGKPTDEGIWNRMDIRSGDQHGIPCSGKSCAGKKTSSGIAR